MKTTLKLFCAIVLTFAQASLGQAQTGKVVKPVVVKLVLSGNVQADKNLLAGMLQKRLGRGVIVTTDQKAVASLQIVVELSQYQYAPPQYEGRNVKKEVKATFFGTLVRSTTQAVSQNANKIRGPAGQVLSGTAQSAGNAGGQAVEQKILNSFTKETEANEQYSICFQSCEGSAGTLFATIKVDYDASSNTASFTGLGIGNGDDQTELQPAFDLKTGNGSYASPQLADFQLMLWDSILADSAAQSPVLIGSDQIIALQKAAQDLVGQFNSSKQTNERGRVVGQKTEPITDQEKAAQERIRKELGGTPATVVGKVQQKKVPKYNP